ncbi:MAG: SEC-C metal-binding domain-containing protein [Microthrixaceae bacterium]
MAIPSGSKRGSTRRFRFDGNHFLSVYDKSWFEFDRSEWRKAKALLTKLGAPPDFHDLKLIEQMLNSSGPTAGRNDPCPCGSGRKYKRCHAGIDEIPLRARLTALYRKSNKWLEVRHNRDVHLHALIRAQHTDMSPAEMLETDLLIADSVPDRGRTVRGVVDRTGCASTV